MYKRTSEFLNYAQTLGVSGAHIAFGSKHPQVRGTYHGHNVRFAFPGSPSDRRSMANARSNFRRYLNSKAPIL